MTYWHKPANFINSLNHTVRASLGSMCWCTLSNGTQIGSAKIYVLRERERERERCECARVREYVCRPNEFQVRSTLAYSHVFISTFRTMPMYNVWGSKTDGDNRERELAQWVWVSNHHEIQNTSYVSFVIASEVWQTSNNKIYVTNVAVCSEWWRKPTVWAVYYKYVHLDMDPALSMK